MLFRDIYNNLLHWYKLDEITGNTIYDSKGTKNGISNTSLSLMTNNNGIINKCLQFTDPCQITITLIPESELSSSFSISFWLKIPSSISDSKNIFNLGNDIILDCSFGINIISNFIFISFSYYDDIYNNIQLSYRMNKNEYTDKWIFITIIVNYTAPRASLYLDSTEVAYQTSDIQTPLNTGTWNMLIGQPFTGYLDNIQIWNKALNKLEVSFLYKERTFNQNVTKYWRVKRYDISNSADSGTVLDDFENLTNPLIIPENLSLLPAGEYGYTLSYIDEDYGINSESPQTIITIA